MKLLLALKISPDLAMLSAADWQPDHQQQIDTRHVRRLLTGYDESAAELVLMLRDQMALDLTALTIADRTAEPALKQLLALEYQQAVRIEPPPEWDLRLNPATIAALIAAYQQRDAQSVIVLGAQSLEGQNGQTAFMLAERLQWPCLRGVCQLAVATEPGALQVTCQTEQGLECLTVLPPLVLVVANAAAASALRVPTLKQKLNAAARQIERLTPDDFGISTPLPADVQLCSLQPNAQPRAGLILAGQNLEQQVEQLYQHYLAERG
ncbi:electron transfer flavoprotein subunit beta/FixA family protein [Serratia microhaemolytica]|uniref:electron transfer flavoprotein subunit beta/FixA family protein n=1 Tax=Serratia microhaemolytica TaxID=2675110 RepID=UPI000FDE6B2A|nr:hypothetical protein [Serratia microhaemolytica]